MFYTFKRYIYKEVTDALADDIPKYRKRAKPHTSPNKRHQHDWHKAIVDTGDAKYPRLVKYCSICQKQKEDGFPIEKLPGESFYTLLTLNQLIARHPEREIIHTIK